MLRAPLPLLLLPLLPLPPLAGVGAAAGPAEKRVVQKEAAFEQLYGDAVNEKLLNIYAFNHSVSRNRVSRRPPACPPRPRRRCSIRAASARARATRWHLGRQEAGAAATPPEGGARERDLPARRGAFRRLRAAAPTFAPRLPAGPGMVPRSFSLPACLPGGLSGRGSLGRGGSA